MYKIKFISQYSTKYYNKQFFLFLNIFFDNYDLGFFIAKFLEISDFFILKERFSK